MRNSVVIMAVWLLVGQSVGLLVGCSNWPLKAAQPDAGQQAAPETELAPISDAVEGERPPITAMDPALMYQILVAEVAGQRADMDLAARYYLSAAEGSDDVGVAKRALRIAVFGKHFEAAYYAARRWTALEPGNIDARKAVAALALRVGRHDEAVDELAQLFSDNPNDLETYDHVVSMLARETDPANGLRVMQELLGRVPPGPEAYLSYGKLAANAKEMDLALVNVEQALNLKPEWAEAEILRAQILIEQDRGDEATAGLARAVSRQPKDPSLRLAYARMLVERNELKQARQEFQRLVRQDPDNADVVYPLALLSLQTEDYEDASARFKHLLKLGEREQESRYYLGNIAAARKRPAEALDWYKKVDEGEYWLEAQTRMARVMADSGDLAGGRSILRALRLQHPDLASRLAVVEGELLMAARENVEAFDLYNQYLVQEPENPDLLYGRALMAERLDRLPMAIADFRLILQKDPDNVHALNALGYTLADRTDQYEEALELVTRAIALRPDDPAVIDSMGWVQYRLGNLKESITWLTRAWDMTGDGEIGAHLGEVLWMSGDHRKARNVWNKSLDKHPDNPVLREVIDRFTTR